MSVIFLENSARLSTAGVFMDTSCPAQIASVPSVIVQPEKLREPDLQIRSLNDFFQQLAEYNAPPAKPASAQS
jgi:hypothetical protein